MNNEPIYFEDFSVGGVYQSYRRTITETDIVNFTQFAGLKLPIFIDEEYGRTQTSYGGRIAPGLLTISVGAGMLDDMLGTNVIAALKFDGLTFLAPVLPGDTIGARIEVVATRPASDGKRGILTLRVEIAKSTGEAVARFDAAFLLWRKGRDSEAA